MFYHMPKLRYRNLTFCIVVNGEKLQIRTVTFDNDQYGTCPSNLHNATSITQLQYYSG